MWQPAASLERQGLCEVRRSPDEPSTISAQEIDDIFRWADVVVAQPFSELAAACLMVAGRDVHKKKLVVDLDDDIWSIHPLNVGTVNGQPTFIKNIFGGDFNDYWELQSITDEQVPEYQQRIDGTVVLNDGKPLFVHQKAPDVTLTAEFMLQAADAVTTTNELLADKFRARANKNVHVLPNCLDLREWGCIQSTTDEVWLGWCGSVSHYPDLKGVAEVIDKLMKRYPKLRLQVMGSSFDYLFPVTTEGLPVAGYQGDGEPLHYHKFEDSKERWPGRMLFNRPVPIQKYSQWMTQEWRSGIGLAPLEDNEFNAAKSELKWLEYSALGACTVASKVGPYKRAIRHNQDGKVCGSYGAWTKALEELIETPALRATLAAEANQRVHDEYDQDKQAHKWLEVYSQWL